MEQQTLSKAALSKLQQMERIAAVNHWRGQCLDNFARIEHSILDTSERLLPFAKSHPFKLEEAAGNRTKMLGKAMIANWPKHSSTPKLVAQLDLWSIREKERNQLVHGRFSVKAAPESKWLLIIDFNSVKKGVCIPGKAMLDERQANAFLTQIKSERKLLEETLKEVEVSFAAQT